MNVYPFDPNRPRAQKPEAAPGTDSLFIRRCRFIEVHIPRNVSSLSTLLEYMAKWAQLPGFPMQADAPIAPPAPPPPPAPREPEHIDHDCPLDGITGLTEQQRRVVHRLASLFADKNCNAFRGRWTKPRHFAGVIRDVCTLSMTQEETQALIDLLRVDAVTGTGRSAKEKAPDDAKAAALATLATVAEQLPDTERTHLAAIAAAIPAAMQGNTRHLRAALRAFTWHMFSIEDLRHLAEHCMTSLTKWAGNGGKKPEPRRWDRRRKTAQLQ